MDRRLQAEYDVIVVGGGSAGVAAALGARQAGRSVLLLERDQYFGGQATNAQLPSYCGFCTNGDDWQQVVKGVGQQLLDKFRARGRFDGFTRSVTGNLIVPHDVETTKLCLDEMVAESGCDFLFGAALVGAEAQNGRISCLEFQDDAGRFTVRAKSYVDASGEGALSAMAGAPTEYHCEQTGSLMFRVGDIDPAANYHATAVRAALDRAVESGAEGLSALSGFIGPRQGTRDAILVLSALHIAGLDARSQTESVLEGRRQAFRYVEALRRFLPGFEKAYLISTGPRMGYRESRRIQGEVQLQKDDVKTSRKQPAVSIARGGWGAELHQGNEDASYALERSSKWFDIPLGALRPQGMENLWCGGRIISADLVASSSVRVMGTSLATGQAAGVAAALSLSSSRYDTAAIQAELVRQGALI